MSDKDKPTPQPSDSGPLVEEKGLPPVDYSPPPPPVKPPKKND